MSEFLTMPPKPNLIKGAAADEHVLAEVERWMAIIREIGQEEIGRKRQATFQALTEDYSSSN